MEPSSLLTCARTAQAFAMMEGMRKWRVPNSVLEERVASAFEVRMRRACAAAQM